MTNEGEQTHSARSLGADAPIPRWPVDVARSIARDAEYRRVFDRHPQPAWIHRLDTSRIVAANRGIATLGGTTQERLLGACAQALARTPGGDALFARAHESASSMSHACMLAFEGRSILSAARWRDLIFDGAHCRLVVFEAGRQQLEAERHRLIAHAVCDGQYVWTVDGDALWVDDNFHAAFGYQRSGEFGLRKTWRDSVHAADRPRIDRAMSGLLASAGLAWEERYRFRRGDGGYEAVIDRAFLTRDARGGPLQLIGGLVIP